MAWPSPVENMPCCKRLQRAPGVRCLCLASPLDDGALTSARDLRLKNCLDRSRQVQKQTTGLSKLHSRVAEEIPLGREVATESEIADLKDVPDQAEPLATMLEHRMRQWSNRTCRSRVGARVALG